MKAMHQLTVKCRQILTEEGTVFSLQWIDLIPETAVDIHPVRLAESYLEHIEKSTLSFIRPTVTASGVEFRLAGTGVSLISFLPLDQSENSAILRLSGGYLLQPHQCDRGEFRFGVEPVKGFIRISIQLSDFCPLLLGNQSPSLLRYWLYRLTQAAIHQLVTVRFLSLVYRELTGVYPIVKTEHITEEHERKI